MVHITKVIWKNIGAWKIYCTVLYGTIHKSYLKKNSVLLLYGTLPNTLCYGAAMSWALRNTGCTDLLTYCPTELPTYQPTTLPIYWPTDLPTYRPTYQHTTYQPTLPTYFTNQPTYWNTDLLTYQPTDLPTYQPTDLLNYWTTDLPTNLLTVLKVRVAHVAPIF